MTKRRIQSAFLSLACASVVFATESRAQNAQVCFVQGDLAAATERPSPLGVVAIPMGDAEATLCYGQPSARGRTVMGELVPFGQPWRTGANEATAIHMPFAGTIGGIEVEPGSYSIYVIPSQDSWEFAINREVERWGIPINEAIQAADVGRVTRPVATLDGMVETFTIEWQAHGEGMGHLVFEWENTQVELPIHRAGMGHH